MTPERQAAMRRVAQQRAQDYWDQERKAYEKALAALLEPARLKRVDRWRAQQEPKLSRNDALRQLIDKALMG